ncbi:MAG: hypothetical protein A2Y00_09960 [Omnitrophica WOR_2 bacterium GWF2_43_52]|nr:MAG: hypothetical protein A2062_07725 [Omnitrophica WOR_2 bacterium GWA2_44_7]OGX21555.1 MAG: hypothetical protein A2Y00_09960 [Omnitrophica WOR_2 bacterium GWF2_43_52]OGX53621.1 MAG: hypothetical protein A2460_00765 [Omnitrophica WOR_2 bacterium RIFOXYC2_FULL_43_9]HAH19440.1 hypothetical protein [Candidatus Omnitrophota bacterium]HBG63811.1 hypothetical protein [Candidatus Omnitrophota bacterium]
MNEIVLTDTAQEQLTALENDRSRRKIEKAVKKTLALMQHNLRHPSLNTHEFTSLKGPHGEKVFEAYAQASTPGAYRIFWYYGPRKNQISVAAITPHP